MVPTSGSVAPRQFWLVKSEPDAFGWQQQVASGVEPWTGVRNHMARNNLKAMRVGDLAFFYHSGVGREIVGVVEVARPAYPDPTAESGDWVCVDMRAVGPMPAAVTLAAMKADRSQPSAARGDASPPAQASLASGAAAAKADSRYVRPRQGAGAAAETRRAAGCTSSRGARGDACADAPGSAARPAVPQPAAWHA